MALKSSVKKPLIISAILLCVGLLGFLAVVHNVPSARAAKASEQADAYLLLRNFPAAITAFKQSLSIEPNADIQIALGVTLARAGRRDEAMNEMQEVAQQGGRAGDTAQKILAKMQKNPNWGLGKKP